MRKQSLQVLYRRCQHSTFSLDKPKSERVKVLPVVTRQYYVPSFMYIDCNSYKNVNQRQQELEETRSKHENHNVVFDSSVLPSKLRTSLTNVIRLLHRCAVNVTLSFGSVKELCSQSVDLRQEIKSLTTLLEQYSAYYILENNHHEHRIHVQNKMLLTNCTLLSTLKCCVRHHNNFADHKYNLLENSDNNNNNNERQHAKHILQLSAWYKKQMECNVITAEDVPHVLNIIQINSHNDKNDSDDVYKNSVTRERIKEFMENNKNGEPTEQINIKPSVSEAVIISERSSSYVLAFILASLEQDMEYDMIESLCSLLSIEDKLFLLQHCCCCERQEECGTILESTKNLDIKKLHTEHVLHTQNVLLTPTVKKLCVSLINELADNSACLTNISAIKLISILSTLHNNSILTNKFLEHALLRVWQCNCETLPCDIEEYVQSILFTLRVAESYLSHHTIVSLLRHSEMYFESCAYQSQIANKFVVNIQPHSAHGLELIVCRLISKYVQEKMCNNQINEVNMLGNDAIDKYIKCAPYTNNATSIYSKFMKLLQVMPTALQSYSIQLLMYTLGRCMREHNNISIDFDSIVHELHLQELGVKAITTTMEMNKYIHFVLRQGSIQTASVLLDGLHTKQEIAAVMKYTYNAGSKMALHALRQLMSIQPSLQCYVAITINAQDQQVNKDNTISDYNMKYNRNREDSKCENQTSVITFYVQRDRVEFGNEVWLSEQFMLNDAFCPFYRLPEREQRTFYMTVLSTVVHGSTCDFTAFVNYTSSTQEAIPKIALPSLLATVPLCAIDKIVRALPSKTSDAFSYWAMCELYGRHVYEAMKVLHAASTLHIMPEMAVLVHLLEVCEELQLNKLYETHKNKRVSVVNAHICSDKLCKVKPTEQSNIAHKVMKFGGSNRMMTTYTTSKKINKRNNQDYFAIFNIAVHFVEEHFSDVALVIFRAYVERFYTRHGKSTLQDEENTINTVTKTFRTKTISNYTDIKEVKKQNTFKNNTMSREVCNFIISFVIHHLTPNCTNYKGYKSCAVTTTTTTTRRRKNSNNNQGRYNFMHYNVNNINSNNNNMYLEAIPLQWEIINALVHNFSINTENNYVGDTNGNVAQVDVIIRSPITREIDWWNSSKPTYKASLIKHLYRQGATSLWPLAWQEIQHIILREQTAPISHMFNLYNLQNNVQLSDVSQKRSRPNKYVQHNELIQMHRALRLMICGCANSRECLERIRSCEHLLMPREEEQARKSWIVNQLCASIELRAIHTLCYAADVFICRGDYRIALELLPPHLNETLPPQLQLSQLTAMQQTEEFAELATLLLPETLSQCKAIQDECCKRNVQCPGRNTRLATRKRKNKLCRFCKVCRRESGLQKNDLINTIVSGNDTSTKVTTQQLLELQGMLYKRPLRKFISSTFTSSIDYESVQ